ncbi:bud site selection protein 20 [Nematocida sp. AWRm80]|nr:bud site selection protein 20 [Nematocida sp. AWRm80]
MSKRKPSKSTNSRKAQHREVQRGCKLRNRAKDLDQIRTALATGKEEISENPLLVQCIECNRFMNGNTLEKHRISRAHKRRLKDLEEDRLLEEDRKNGMF